MFTDADGHERATTGVDRRARPARADRVRATCSPTSARCPRPSTDRLALLQATRANLDPIWGLSLARGPDRSSAIPTTTRCARPSTARACSHALWPRSTIPHASPRSATRSARAPLVLADGHHRFETASRVPRRTARRRVDDRGRRTRSWRFVVELADDELSIEPIHRLIAPAGRRRPTRRARRTRSRHHRRGPSRPRRVDRARAHDGRRRRGSGWSTRDGLALARPRLDVVTPRSPVEPPDGAQRRRRRRSRSRSAAASTGPARVPQRRARRRRARRQGAADAAVLLRPVTVAEIRAAAAYAGARMPQKTTFFSPKPRTGLVFRTLD